MSDYLPLDLLTYLEEDIEDPYDSFEYQILFGYIRWASYQDRETVHEVTYLIDDFDDIDLGRFYHRYLPPFIRGATISGIDCDEAPYGLTYGSLCRVGEGYIPLTGFDLIPQFTAYLVSYDTKFHWSKTILRLLWDRCQNDKFVSAARAAASVGNLPLTRTILDGRMTHDSLSSSGVVRSVLIASIDMEFFDRLLHYYPRVNHKCYFRHMIEDILLHDRVDVFVRFTEMDGNMTRWEAHLDDFKAVRIKQYLDSSMKDSDLY